MNIYEEKFYRVSLAGFKPTIVRLKKISNSQYVCFFMSLVYINNYKTLGFQVEIKDNIASFTNEGIAPLDFLIPFWDYIFNKIDTPDYIFTIHGFEDDQID